MTERGSRRELLRRAAVLAVALVPPVGFLRGQRPGQSPAKPDSAAADPLYQPDIVQQRPVVTASDNDPVVKDLEHKLKCTCGCNLDIYTCRTTDFTCTYSPALHREVVELRAEGKSPDQVIAAFVSRYGEQILMAPPPEGFNLAGYLVPGALVALAGTLLAAVLVRRGRRMAAIGRGPVADPLAAPLPASAEDRERLRRALADLQD